VPSTEAERRWFAVHMTQSVSCVVEVEATDHAGAMDLAAQNAPTPTNATNRGIDPEGEWHVVVVEQEGREVYREPDPRDAEIAELRERVRKLQLIREAAEEFIETGGTWAHNELVKVLEQ